MKNLFLIVALLITISFLGQEKVGKNKEQVKENHISASKPVSKYIISEEVPTYPGCTGNNFERRKCTDISIRKFIGRNFDVNNAKCLKLTKKYNKKLKKYIEVCKKAIKNKRVRIKTTFVIDTLGNITNITTKSAYPTLNKEATRVLRSLPVLKPGKQRGKKVKVRMALPIQFKIQ